MCIVIVDLYKISEIRKLMNRYGFKPEKHYGQNFIVDKNVCPKMSEMCSDGGECGILEVGPGVGVLTVELAKRYKKVVSIEIDKSLIPVLNNTLSDFDNVKVINGDIMSINLKELLKDEFRDMDVCVCANLPYYITSPVIMKFLEDEVDIKRITVMVQKEAGQRICAEPGERECGAISVGIRYYATPRVLFHVPRGCFFPAPEVDSSVISLEINDTHKKDIKNKRLFFEIIRIGFSQRRKTLIKLLRNGIKICKEDLEELFISLDIPLNIRAENVLFEQFVLLSNGIEKIINP